MWDRCSSPSTERGRLLTKVPLLHFFLSQDFFRRHILSRQCALPRWSHLMYFSNLERLELTLRSLKKVHETKNQTFELTTLGVKYIPWCYFCTEQVPESLHRQKKVISQYEDTLYIVFPFRGKEQAERASDLEIWASRALVSPASRSLSHLPLFVAIRTSFSPFKEVGTFLSDFSRQTILVLLTNWFLDFFHSILRTKSIYKPKDPFAQLLSN